MWWGEISTETKPEVKSTIPWQEAGGRRSPVVLCSVQESLPLTLGLSETDWLTRIWLELQLCLYPDSPAGQDLLASHWSAHYQVGTGEKTTTNNWTIEQRTTLYTWQLTLSFWTRLLNFTSDFTGKLMKPSPSPSGAHWLSCQASVAAVIWRALITDYITSHYITLHSTWSRSLTKLM